MLPIYGKPEIGWPNGVPRVRYVPQQKLDAYGPPIRRRQNVPGKCYGSFWRLSEALFTAVAKAWCLLEIKHCGIYSYIFDANILCSVSSGARP